MSHSTELRSEDFAALARPIATALYGEPNRRLSRGARLRYGRKGSLSVDADIGIWKDFESGAGGGVLDLVVHAGAATTRAEAARWVKDLDGPAPVASTASSSIRLTPSRTDTRDFARRIWNATEPIGGTVAAAYLESRGVGHVVGVPALRFHPSIRHPNPDVPGRFPALVAGVQDMHGAFLGIQRTFLDGAHKAAVEPARASLGPIAGGAVRLAPVSHGRLLVGEGIETTAAAMRVLDLRQGGAWAALSTSGLTALALPSDVHHVIIAADRDAGGAGQLAAAALAERLHADGLRVSIKLPPFVGDWNDVLTIAGGAS